MAATVLHLPAPAPAASAAGAVSATAAAPSPCAVGKLPDAPSASADAADLAVGAGVVPTDEQIDEVVLDASKLHVYHLALELHTQCSVLVAPLQRVLRDQLERASLSVILNIAEGGGRRSRKQKAYFYVIARGSATEVAALLDVLQMRRLAPSNVLRTARRLAVRAVQMLTKMHESLSK